MNAVTKVKKRSRRVASTSSREGPRAFASLDRENQAIDPQEDVAGCACVIEERVYLSSWIWHVMIYTRFIAYYNKLLEVPVAWIYKFFFVVHAHTPYTRTYIHASHTFRSAINNVTFNKRCHAAREENWSL